MQAVATTPGGEIVQGYPQVVLSEEPVQRIVGVLDPEALAGNMMSLDARFEQRGGVYGQLIELRLRSGPRKVTLSPYKRQPAAGTLLKIYKPFQRTPAHVDHVSSLHPFSAHQQGVRQLGAAITHNVIAPRPLVGCVRFERVHKPFAQ